MDPLLLIIKLVVVGLLFIKILSMPIKDPGLSSLNWETLGSNLLSEVYMP